MAAGKRISYCIIFIIITFLSSVDLKAVENPFYVSPLTFPSIDASAQLPPMPDTIPGYRMSESERWWLNRLKAGKLDLNDTTVRYPKFLDFCLGVYHWADKFFNSYDPDYVTGTGKRWKARIVNDNWTSSHQMTFPDKLHMDMLSQLYANMGAYVQYMAVSAGYTFDMNNIAHDKPMDHAKMEFGFNCALFNVDMYYHENTGGTYIRRFGQYKRGEFFKEWFPGVKLYKFGVDATYFFNHKRYSQGAAYNFSKFQKKSQGSWIIGFSYVNNDISFDFTQLPLDLLPYITIPVSTYHFHYRSYALMGGYGFNWVIKPKLLFNATLTPSLGVTHCYEDSLEGARWMPSMNLVGRSSITYNLGNFFFSGIFRFNGQWYRSKVYSLFSAIENFSANIGFRF